MHYAIVPAAGSGARLGAEMPKQYLSIMGRPLIWYSLAMLCRHPAIARVWVVLAPDDEFWGMPQWRDLWLDLGARLEVVFCGGRTRSASVRNALDAAATAVAPEDWVLVHDAARPCLSRARLDHLLETLRQDPVGGLLAAPLADTLKQDDGSPGRAAPPAVARTLPRDGLWQAQTPQMFRYAMLREALEKFPEVTDEAGAMEAAGHAPRLVASDIGNLKVTYPDDLALAEWILRGRRESED
ncbi:MAG: 2-C-methyl-D-erythritol 4-phosphate cytidylyltransferase [Zoogloeaceae bacterium]|jgi:2-C-methyl-D-erythritol 4-phosphate cytidylyltransferase|nr:2-C-methyl-D-erythritol 4-phosphate cytidylyltransferase [Zoogloeaceae bacterium]